MRFESMMTWWPLASLALWLMHCEATIRIVESGREYRSWPDQELGPKLADGAVYKARLQQIQGNPHLCFAGLNWKITVPDDGLPVALIVKSGICSYETKAQLASKYITPLGVVKFLIIDGYYYRHVDSTDPNQKHESNYSQYSPNTRPALLPDMLTFKEFEAKNMHHQESQSVRTGSASSLVDSKLDLHSDEVTVSVLHVSMTTGYSMLEHLLRERDSTKASGGSLLELTGDSPSEKGETTRMIWLVVVAFMGLSCCLCLMSFISSVMEASEPSTHPPTVRPRRRRLTPWQVRKKFPLGVFENGQLNFFGNQRHLDHDVDETQANIQEILPVSPIDTDSQNLLQPPLIITDHTCIICLDDYIAGDKLRYLPCEHVFHSKCISKWLTERSATCPLCKIDLYESDNEDENEESLDINPLSSSWNSVPPEAHTAQSMLVPEQQWQRETLSTGSHSRHSHGWWWLGQGGRWGNWNFRGQNSTISHGISSLTEPLLHEGNDEAGTHVSAVIPLDVTP